MTGQTPEIQPLQFESDDVGKLPRSVNMFRGDVNYAKSLVQLPGKPDDSTLSSQHRAAVRQQRQPGRRPMEPVGSDRHRGTRLVAGLGPNRQLPAAER